MGEGGDRRGGGRRGGEGVCPLARNTHTHVNSNALSCATNWPGGGERGGGTGGEGERRGGGRRGEERPTDCALDSRISLSSFTSA